VFRRDIDFKAVFTSVSSAGDNCIHTEHCEAGKVVRTDFVQLLWYKRLQDIDGLRSLNGKQSDAVTHIFDNRIEPVV